MATQFANGKIVTDGLVLCLDAADQTSYPTTGTTWFDLAGSNNGTLTNGPTFSGTGASSSIVFDGTDDVVSVNGNASINLPGDYTVEVWVNTNTISTSPSVKVITSKWNTDPKSMYIGFFPSGFLSHYRTLANNTHYNATFAINASDFINKWNQVVGITSGSTIQIWCNGVLKDSVSWPGVASVPDTPLFIGGLGGGTQPFSGKISSEKIYNRALSAQEVLQNYNAQKARFGIY
jgi:hypothetical protein